MSAVEVVVAVPIGEGQFTGLVTIVRESDDREQALGEVCAALDELGRWVEDISLRSVTGATAAELEF